MKVAKAEYLMKPVLSSTGAIRLEGVKGDMLMVQIASKSMLMNVKTGQRVVDDCISPRQRELMEAAKREKAEQEARAAAGGAAAGSGAPLPLLMSPSAQQAASAAVATGAASAPAAAPRIRIRIRIGIGIGIARRIGAAAVGCRLRRGPLACRPQPCPPALGTPAASGPDIESLQRHAPCFARRRVATRHGRSVCLAAVRTVPARAACPTPKIRTACGPVR